MSTFLWWVRSLLMMLGLLWCWQALAHGQHFTDEENTWLNEQYASDGTKCCDRHDAVVGPDVEWRIQGDLYQVLINRTWRTVPPELVMRREPGNPWPGQAIVTYSVYPSGNITIWCFWPGMVM